eukprot:2000341-Prymnesium_polylepis.1
MAETAGAARAARAASIPGVVGMYRSRGCRCPVPRNLGRGRARAGFEPRACEIRSLARRPVHQVRRAASNDERSVTKLMVRLKTWIRLNTLFQSKPRSHVPNPEAPNHSSFSHC